MLTASALLKFWQQEFTSFRPSSACSPAWTCRFDGQARGW